MSLGRQESGNQEELWVPTEKLARGPSSPFYGKLNGILREEQFDGYVEERCAEYYAENRGRPGIPPGVYFRMLLIGYFERIPSDRAIAWRCSDSLSLRRFLGCSLEEETPDHSSLCRIRQRLPLEVHEEVFGWVLSVLARRGLIDGKTLGVDATTLEANAALRSLVRRDTGEGYEGYLRKLAKESGIENPTRSDIAKLDRKRKKKGSNKEWKNPHDPDAEITKMKGGGTDMGHKLDQAVDLGGEGAAGGVRQPAADQRRARQAAAAQARGTAGAAVRALPQRRRHAPNVPARAREHPEAAAGARGRLQSRAAAAQHSGMRDAAAVRRGGQCRAFGPLGTPGSALRDRIAIWTDSDADPSIFP